MSGPMTKLTMSVMLARRWDVSCMSDPKSPSDCLRLLPIMSRSTGDSPLPFMTVVT